MQQYKCSTIKHGAARYVVNTVVPARLRSSTAICSSIYVVDDACGFSDEAGNEVVVVLRYVPVYLYVAVYL